MKEFHSCITSLGSGSFSRTRAPIFPLVPKFYLGMLAVNKLALYVPKSQRVAFGTGFGNKSLFGKRSKVHVVLHVLVILTHQVHWALWAFGIRRSADFSPKVR